MFYACDVPSALIISAPSWTRAEFEAYPKVYRIICTLIVCQVSLLFPN